MHAIRLHAFGPAENLVLERTDDPVPGPGQVRITVAAAGVHLLDTALREGMTGPYPTPAELPTIPGREVAGTVDGLGAGTDPSWLGKRVVVHLGMVPGGYAELAVADASRLHEIPDNLDAAEAVAMIGTGRTTMGILQFTPSAPATSRSSPPPPEASARCSSSTRRTSAPPSSAWPAAPPRSRASPRTAPTSPSTTHCPTGPRRSAPTSTAAPPPSSSTPSAARPAAPPSTSSARAGSTSSSAGPERDCTTASR